jgi:tetratricopeptide (TPR) repeat protein
LNQDLLKKIFFVACFFLAAGFLFSTEIQAQSLLDKADSSFAKNRFSEAKALYEASFFENRTTNPAALLKLAFIETSMDNFLKAIFFLHQFYLFNPDPLVKNKIEEMANQNKLLGYAIDEADYAYFLYRSYRKWGQGFLLAMATLLFMVLVYRKIKKVSLGYSPIFTLLFVLAAAYFYNFKLPYKRAILAEEHIFLMSGPSGGASVVSVLGKGHRVEWIGESDIWFEIKWNDKKGWVKKSQLLFFL